MLKNRNVDNEVFGLGRTGLDDDGHSWLARRHRFVAVLVMFVILAASCGVDIAEPASVRAEPADDSSTQASESVEGGEPADSPDATSGQDADSAGSQAATDGLAPLVEGIKVQYVQLPIVPSIVFPDVSELSEVGADIESELGQYSAAGVTVASATCDNTGERLHKMQEDGFLRIEVDENGAGSYRDDSFPSGRVEVNVSADGSGTYRNDTFPSGRVEVNVNADGSGKYRNDTFPSGRIEVNVNADGSGSYRNDTFSSGRLEVTLDGAGQGYYRNDTFSSGRVEIEASADGSGTFRDDTYASGRKEFERQSESAFVLYDDSDPSGRIELEVLADGSGTYYNDTGEDTIRIVVASDGTGTYEDDTGETNFQTGVGILDPGLVQTSAVPELVADRSVPSLDRLAPLQAPCASVIRIDSNVLFDFDSDQLRTTAGPVLDQIAATLVGLNKPLEVQGHTDSKGEDAYNLDLSERRALAVASALQDRGVVSEITSSGLGESAPVAPNETADGADNPAGRQQNRRVEIVVDDD